MTLPVATSLASKISTPGSDRLEDGGRFVACSSGTTGKPAMLGATEADLDFASLSNVSSFSWATGVAPGNDRRFFGLGPRTNVTRNERTREALVGAFHSDTSDPYQLPLPMITTGAIMSMILLRRKITDGTALASEVAEFERLSAERPHRLRGRDGSRRSTSSSRVRRAEAVPLWDVVDAVSARSWGSRERLRRIGLPPRQHPAHRGRPQGSKSAPDYREVVQNTFGVADERDVQLLFDAGGQHAVPSVPIGSLSHRAVGHRLAARRTGRAPAGRVGWRRRMSSRIFRHLSGRPLGRDHLR